MKRLFLNCVSREVSLVRDERNSITFCALLGLERYGYRAEAAEIAQRLLDEHPEATINDIALRCGFVNQAHFSSTFQKIFGIAPSQWAKRTKEQE